MGNRLLYGFMGVDVLFAASAGLVLAVVLMTRNNISGVQTTKNVAVDLLLDQCPLTAALANSIFMFATFVFSLPALILRDNRGWLKLHGWLVIVCAIFSLLVGLVIWIETLKTRTNLDVLWGKQSAAVQSLLQQTFQCCGYTNSTSPPFIVDNTCTSALVAAQLQGCESPFGTFANRFLDIVFTADFGIVAVDFILLLFVAMVLKERKEEERYRLIDAKTGAI